MTLTVFYKCWMRCNLVVRVFPLKIARLWFQFHDRIMHFDLEQNVTSRVALRSLRYLTYGKPCTCSGNVNLVSSCVTWTFDYHKQTIYLFRPFSNKFQNDLSGRLPLVLWLWLLSCVSWRLWIYIISIPPFHRVYICAFGHVSECSCA